MSSAVYAIDDFPIVDWDELHRRYMPPREAFSKVPQRVDEWADRADALEAQIAILQEQLDEARALAYEYVPNPDYDPAIADKWFPKIIRIGQRYDPDVSTTAVVDE